MFTSTTASRVRDLCREVQLSTCGRPRNHAIVQIRARVRNNGNMNLNLAAIRIIGLIAHKSKCVGCKCSHELRPPGFEIFVGKYNSLRADDLETMR